MKSRHLSGFALPTVLIASIVMLTVLLMSVTSTVAVRVALQTQYLAQLSQTASDAGVAYAKACLLANNGAPLWSDANPLGPDTNCSGVALDVSICPADTTNACHSVTKNAQTVSTFSVKLPAVDSNGKATTINSSGAVKLLRTSDNSIWRQYNQENVSKVTTSPTVSVLVVGGGGGGGKGNNNGYESGGGGGGGVIFNPSFVVSDKTYSITVGAGGASGNNGKNSSVITNTAIQYGYSSSYPGKSCYSLRLDGISEDGSYWIDPDGTGPNTPFKVYCDMNYDSGGWTMLMKATRGTTFNYNANYWTTANTLNDNDLSRVDADAKYRSFNELGTTDIMARWPDAGDTRWLNDSVWSSRTALAGFDQYRNWGNNNLSPYWNATYFSSQVVQTTTNPGPSAWGIKLGDLGGSANGGARWGYRFNENGAGDYGSDDVGGGIGIRHTGYLYSAGDWYSCCGTTGMNRSARVEVYGRNSTDTPDVASAIIAYGGGAGGTAPNTGSYGGSGGGGTHPGTGGGAGISGQGNSGGVGGSARGGGGGGAGGAGGATGLGGVGIINSISGSSQYYGGGGGAYIDINGGLGGGGNSTTTLNNAVSNGSANTGGGGAGAYTSTGVSGGTGGSGIVIISYPTGSLSATGGTITQVGANTVHTFMSNGIFVILPNTSVVKVLAVGGGGGGGNNHGGGGGGGGVTYSDAFGITTQSYSVVVGNGGSGGVSTGSAGSNGGNSSLSNLVAVGGGGGGGRINTNAVSQSTIGGSGGGGAGTIDGATGQAGLGSSGTMNQGSKGGNGISDATAGNGGGGGGSAVNGGNASGGGCGVGISGIGGNGLQYSISGTAVYYGGGGSGGRWCAGAVGVAGLGGGGIGGANDLATGGNGAANTGGGGGGGGGGGAVGGTGGSGVVIISYPSGAINATGGIITYIDSNNLNSRSGTPYVGGYTIHTFNSSGIFQVFTNNLQKNLVSYWKMDETYGKTVYDSFGTNNGTVKTNAFLYYPFDASASDASTSGNDATLYGTSLTTDRFSNASSAFSFNGIGNRMLTTNTMTIDTRTSSYLVSAWVYTLDNPADVNHFQAIIMDDNGSGQNNATFGIMVKSDGTGVGAWGCGNSGPWVSIPSILNGWHHIAAVYTINPTTFTPVRMYVDGVYVGNSVTDRATYCAASYRLGIGNSYVGYPTYFKGNIDEVFVNRSSNLTPNDADIARLYAVTAAHDMNKPWISGNKNGAYDFWGYSTSSNDSPVTYIDMGSNFNSVVNGVATPFSMSFWTYRRSGSGQAQGRQFGWYGGNYKGTEIGVDENGVVRLTVGRGNTTGVNSNYDYISGSGAAPTNQWNHIVVTYDGTNVIVYLNSTVLSSYNIGANVDNGNGTQPFMVNKNSWDFYGGGMGKYDEMGVWSRALSQSEITSLFNLSSGL